MKKTKEVAFKFKRQDDGCQVVECPKHGVLGRVLVGVSIECKPCRKWLKVEYAKTNK